MGKEDNETYRTEEQFISNVCNVIEDNLFTKLDDKSEVQELMTMVTLELKKRWLPKEEEKSRILTLGDI